MKKKTIILPIITILVVVLIIIFYKEGILFNNNSDHDLDSLIQISDTIKGTEVPLGSPPEVNSEIGKDTIKSGSSNTGTKPDGIVPTKNKQEKDTIKKIVPLGDPPKDEKNNSGNQGNSGDPVKEDRSK